MRKTLLAILILIIIVPIALATFVFTEYTATPETNQVSISWKTSSESGVALFAILRSSDDSHFAQIGSVEARGEGSDYKFIDENVFFKTGQTFFYKIRALNTDNSVVEETQSLIVNPNISGIFRTWGTIKAIFR
jgi:hypothetical protein